LRITWGNLKTNQELMPSHYKYFSQIFFLIFNFLFFS
jgi:hypothetical protein